jgi:pSer/pThr/pTyr-binding forkhead associated (FHA) protein
MDAIGATDLLTFGLRLLFAAALYAVVAAGLAALRRDLRQTAGRGMQPAPAPGQARLLLVEAAPVDGPAGRSVSLDGELTVGRRAPCDLTLRDDAVSARHARFARRNGAWYLEDLGSTNGTYLNGRRVSTPEALQPGDLVTTGVAVWRFEVSHK